jgi:hypothetical protein
VDERNEQNENGHPGGHRNGPSELLVPDIIKGRGLRIPGRTTRSKNRHAYHGNEHEDSHG